MFCHLARGHQPADGSRSQIDVHPIIAILGRGSGRMAHTVPALTRRKLIRRDRNLCAYCGQRFRDDDLTTDHVVPVSKGGRDVWTNVLSACRGCNSAKGNREPHEWGRLPLFIAYTPNIYEGLILANRSVLADQMEFLMQGVGQQSRLKSLAAAESPSAPYADASAFCPDQAGIVSRRGEAASLSALRIASTCLAMARGTGKAPDKTP